jgi:hypothetical protein
VDFSALDLQSSPILDAFGLPRSNPLHFPRLQTHRFGREFLLHGFLTRVERDRETDCQQYRDQNGDTEATHLLVLSVKRGRMYKLPKQLFRNANRKKFYAGTGAVSIQA